MTRPSVVPVLAACAALILLGMAVLQLALGHVNSPRVDFHRTSATEEVAPSRLLLPVEADQQLTYLCLDGALPSDPDSTCVLYESAPHVVQRGSS